MSTYNYITMNRMRLVMRNLFLTETGLRRLRVGRWLINNCTNAHLQVGFNLPSLAAAAALRNRIETKVNTYLVPWETKHAELMAAEALAETVEGE